MKLSPNTHQIFTDFFSECNFCEGLEFPKVQIYSRTGAKILTKIIAVDGITFGRHIFVNPKFVKVDKNGNLVIQKKLLAHELVHVMQYEKLGFWGFLRKYFKDFWRIFKNKEKWSFVTWFESYRDIPHEVEARHFASNFMEWIEFQKK
jgi:hypothetical protein